jgi:hypothetical protein
MERYKNYSPTEFDRKGIVLDDRQEWFVAPVIRTRDSGCLENSNFECCLATLGGESDTVEVHRFGHWGPGWFEIIILDCFDRDKVLILEDIEKGLTDYPVIDDNHFSELEYNTAQDNWGNMSIRDRIYVCKKYNVSILKARHDYIPEEVEISYLAE